WQLENVGQACGKPGALGYCDPGAICAAAPGCPTQDVESACEAVAFGYRAKRGRFKLRCNAKRSLDPSISGPLSCGSTLRGESVGAASVSQGAFGGPVAAYDAVPVSDCRGPQFAGSAPKTMVKHG